MTESEIKIYQTEDGQTKIDVKFDNETVWLTQKQMAQLFDKDSDTIGLHLKNIYQSGELEELSTTEESSVVQLEGKRQVRRKIKLYNLAKYMTKITTISKIHLNRLKARSLQDKLTHI